MAEQRRDVRDERGVDEVNEADDDARDARGAGRREMPDEVARAWDELVATARRTVADGLVVGTSGNVSVRVGDTLLVTPTGVPYDRLTPDDVTGVDLTGRQVLGTLRPTSELPMHLAIHTTAGARADTTAGARADTTAGARAVVHTHAVHATAVSTLVDELPLIHYMSAALGGPVRVAPYATYGTPELAENMLRALRGRTACLLRNHGTIAYGDSLDEAYDRTTQLEWMCQVWLKASSVPHLTPHLLTLGQLAETGERLKGYGQPG
ncbi:MULTISPECIES: class II aldolase/adducin family protein [Streptomyces]|uniref:class II aldolase/adducin family protein n=1 Tax=Streptomyces TaxID=1883 RepID=UPI0004E6D51B|nr:MULTISPECIES: class II aldolase/adducin family protein [Streptomyces]KFG04962.1 fuculose phosphate aldolase [Streptomyces scabiei]MBP5894535.1 class II aldolase/adducin family protein [Streptomyces sp. LBUM 1481]MBP5917728.1 class II aldolase/adducin family protein [Streptomyces sp. LBUM 1486]MBP5924802.1 class II aldolase/adducin family protein [Streptomyces sp. LBUM 1483]MDX2575328.1 class II aldolase/adducin family protein [Streptomyces scabiei]